MKTAVFLATGFEEIEALTVVDLLRRAQISCDMVSIEDELTVSGSHGIKTTADMLLSEVAFDEYDCMILPGGMPGTRNLEGNQYLMSKLDDFYRKNKLICAICAAPTIFGHKGYLEGKAAVCYPGMEDELKGAFVPEEEVVKDGNIITSRGMGTSVEFGLKLLVVLTDKANADRIAASVMVPGF